MRTAEIIISSLEGFAPVQAEGTIDGTPFYFRSRGQVWSFSVGRRPVSDPDFYIKREYSSEPFAAGFISEEEARGFIFEAAEEYLSRLEREDATRQLLPLERGSLCQKEESSRLTRVGGV